MKTTLLTSLLVLFSSICIAGISAKEKQALIDFYNSTNGAKWNQHWDISLPADTWQGVTIENNSVTAISLLFNNIEGTIPSTIGDLQNLRVLELSFNKISGSLPESLGNLTKLEVLAFNGNYLSGSIPASLGNLKSLKQLHLSSNTLSGELPAYIANLGKLEVLNVFDNDLSGEIPGQIAGIKTLKELVLAENNFSNTSQFSVVLLMNTAKLDLNDAGIVPPAKSVIAIESSEDGN